MKVLDLFCGAGGAAMGIHRAWPVAEIVGVDIKPQPRYPFRFVQEDAMITSLEGYDFIWASPPCQAFTSARVIHGKEHQDLLTPTRDRLEKSGTKWIIENVIGAPMRCDALLCGSMFGQRKLRRHRMFEFDTPILIITPPCHHGAITVSVFGHGGHVYNGVKEWRDIMGIDWMNRDELAQAIPPFYSEFLCRQIKP